MSYHALITIEKETRRLLVDKKRWFISIFFVFVVIHMAVREFDIEIQDKIELRPLIERQWNSESYTAPKTQEDVALRKRNTKDSFLTTYKFKDVKERDLTGCPEKVVFLKKHKCGSSTVHKVFGNFVDYTGILTEKPMYYSLGGCYPAPYDPKCRTTPHPKEHQSVTFHHRLNYPLQSKLMPNAKFYTTVREPLSLFYSVYNYFYYKFERVEEMAPGCNNECMGQPFVSINNNTAQVSANDYLDHLEERYDPDMPWAFRMRNFQSFEMGLDKELEDDKEIQQFLDDLENQFHFVVVLDKYAESMVLLAAHLDIPLEYMVVPPNKVAEKYPKPSFNEEQMATLKKFHKVDYAVYERFKEILEDKIDEFGRERMAIEVERYNNISKKCARNRSLCSPKAHAKSDERIGVLRAKLRASLEFEHVPIDRDYVVETMEKHRGYCDVGMQKIFREKTQMPVCVTKRDRVQHLQGIDYTCQFVHKEGDPEMEQCSIVSPKK